MTHWIRVHPRTKAEPLRSTHFVNLEPELLRDKKVGSAPKLLLCAQHLLQQETACLLGGTETV